MVPALELYELSHDDPAGARNAYFNIVQRAPSDQLEDVLEKNGLSSVFADATMQQIAALLEKNF